MEQYSVVEFLSKYVIIPLVTGIASLGWYVVKKQNDRLDTLKAEVDNMKQEIAEIKTEIKTEFKYISRDIKEVKELLVKLSDKK